MNGEGGENGGVFGGGFLTPMLMAGIVHEFNNMAGGVMSRLELALADGAVAERADASMREAVEILDRVCRVTDQILQLATDRVPGKERIEPEIPLRRALAMQEPELTWAGVEVEEALVCRPCWLHAELLTHAVSNLLSNALREVGQQKYRHIRLEARLEGDWLCVCVGDNGRGFSPQQLQELARPLREYRQARGTGRKMHVRGFGLGLFLVRWIALVHGGRAEFANAEDGGAICTLRLPAGVAAEIDGARFSLEQTGDRLDSVSGDGGGSWNERENRPRG